MSLESLKTFDWNTSTYAPMAGTEGWIEVVDIDEGGYEWTTFRAYYSPSSRRYFWNGGSGCSCNSWSDGIETASDFEDGDKAALLRAWRTFAEEHQYTIRTEDYLDGVEQIKKFMGESA